MAVLPKSLVIGYGSIGKRHTEVLQSLGAETAVVSQHAEGLTISNYTSLQEALTNFHPEYVVIANRTVEHFQTLEQLEELNYKGHCLVEKPLTATLQNAVHSFGFQIYVGYVLRCHPLIEQAKALLFNKSLISIQSYVGQYLPDWRPGIDYRTCYSASKELGGGVIRDLSHELDYIQYIAGLWIDVTALGGHFSDLQINSDDTFGLMIRTANCPLVLCQMNYLDRNVRRDCTIQYEGGSIQMDFMQNTLTHNGSKTDFKLERNDLFRNMHQAVWKDTSTCLCSIQEALSTIGLIEAAETASEERRWIQNPNR